MITGEMEIGVQAKCFLMHNRVYGMKETTVKDERHG